MKPQYRYVCPNCGNEGYACKALFEDERICHCIYCDEVLTLKFNYDKKEFTASYYFTYPQRTIYG
jgi:predicted nucleic acid-binding Zn ribbon protein